MEIKNVKQSIIFSIILCFILIACKAKQTTTTLAGTDTSANFIKTEGIVSHQYKQVGCETIVICSSSNANDTLFLIPMTPLEKFDVDGLKISFSYRILRVHNPKGCHQGIPVQISNIKKNKNKKASQ
ncbi:MAG TPA: hypothetical protein VK835_03410 [Bacteroidia bacterium]|jgi:hypothetical protein|nr:hypothetical protein [Bacteroidia bacterium]